MIRIGRSDNPFISLFDLSGPQNVTSQGDTLDQFASTL